MAYGGYGLGIDTSKPIHKDEGVRHFAHVLFEISPFLTGASSVGVLYASQGESVLLSTYLMVGTYAIALVKG
jgi:hypothetical protein